MTLAEVDAQLADLTTWRDQLVGWRNTLCDRLLTLQPRDNAVYGLKLSIMRIDRNLDLKLPDCYLLTAPLNDLTQGCSWRGCLPDVQRQIKELQQHRLNLRDGEIEDIKNRLPGVLA